MSSQSSEPLTAALPDLPVLPLRDVVVYPHMVIPLFVGREKSMKALEAAMAGNRQILLVAQQKPETDDPAAADLYAMGTVASLLQLLKLPDGTVKVLVEGQSRARASDFRELDGMLRARVETIEPGYARPGTEMEAAVRMLVSLFEQLVKQSRKLPPEVLSSLSGIEDPSRLADSIAGHLSVRLSKPDIQTTCRTESAGARSHPYRRCTRSAGNNRASRHQTVRRLRCSPPVKGADRPKAYRPVHGISPA